MKTADLHCDTVGRIQTGADISTSSPEGHVDLPRLRAGDVRLQAFAAYIKPDTPDVEALSSTLTKLDAIDRLCADHPDGFVRVEDADSAERIADTWTATDGGAARTGPVGVLLTVENGHAINGDLANLETLRRRGVRIMTLVHSKHLDWVASCTGGDCAFDGLTPFGEKVVEAMNEMGMVVDVSHASESAFWKVAKVMRRSGKPFMASHSNAWELCGYERNLKDDQVREIADQGGVIGINFFPFFLDQEHLDAAKEKRKELGAAYRRLMAGYPVYAERIADHIDHIVGLAGDECVGFGSDWDGILSTPEDVTGSDGYPVILRLLEKRGYSAETLEKLCWKNALRVLRAHD